MVCAISHTQEILLVVSYTMQMTNILVILTIFELSISRISRRFLFVFLIFEIRDELITIRKNFFYRKRFSFVLGSRSSVLEFWSMHLINVIDRNFLNDRMRQSDMINRLHKILKISYLKRSNWMTYVLLGTLKCEIFIFGIDSKELYVELIL